MNDTRPDIERIVREVLRRIGAGNNSDSVERSAIASTRGHAVATTGNGELELTGKVISLSQIEGRLEGVRKVAASAGAVVTPSVRDYLKQHDIQLSVRISDEDQLHRSMLWLAPFAARCDTAGLCHEVRQRGLPCGVLSDSSLPAIARQLARRLDGQATAVMLTSEVAVATCAVNRHPSIRGFVASDLVSLTNARQAIGGNLLIVDPAVCARGDIREMACRMADHAPPVPFQWQSVL